MPESAGTIGFLTAPGLFRDLLLRKATGQLVARHGEVVKKVFFKSGFVLYAVSSLPGDRLGDILLARGVIDRAQYEESARQVVASGRKQGSVLVQLGALTPRELFDGLIAQVREIVISLCGWDQGQWQFVEGLPAREEIVSLHLQPAGLIFEGLARIAADPRWSGVWNRRPAGLHSVAEPPLPLEQFEAPDDARRLVPLIEQGQQPREMARLIGRSEGETTALLYGLALLGLIGPRPAPAAKPKKPAPAPTAAPAAARAPAARDESPFRAQREEPPPADSRVAKEQFTKGLALLNTGDVWSAIQSLRWAVNLAPQNPQYHTWLGVALLRTRKRLLEAEEQCRAAIALDPNNAQHYVHLGQVYRSGEQVGKAKEQFETALWLDPKHAGALKEIRELEAASAKGFVAGP